jgi:hypothetical protein
MEREAAGRLMVEALYLAATQDKEAAVADYLDLQLQRHQLSLIALQKHFHLLPEADWPPLNGHQHELSPYDQLLKPNPQDEPPTPLPSSPPTAALAPSLTLLLKELTFYTNSRVDEWLDAAVSHLACQGAIAVLGCARVSDSKSQRSDAPMNHT